MSQPGYTVVSGSVAVGSATTKSILSVIASSSKLPTICELSLGFDSSSTSGKAAVQLCQSTQATAGTTTAFTPLQIRGKTRAASCTAAINYTVEPTVLTVVKDWYVDITTGLTIQFPLGRESEGDLSTGTIKAYVLRVITPPTAVNARAYLEFEE